MAVHPVFAMNIYNIYASIWVWLNFYIHLSFSDGDNASSLRNKNDCYSCVFCSLFLYWVIWQGA